MEFDEQNFIDKCRMIHSAIKIDSWLCDTSGKIAARFVNHSLPVVVDRLSEEMVDINRAVRCLPQNSYYHYQNSYGLEYIAVGLWTGNAFQGTLLAGPVISGLSVVERMQDIFSANNLPIGQRKQLEEFYQSLPLLSEVELKDTGELIVNLCAHHQVKAHYFTADTPKPVLDPAHLQVDIEDNQQIIEKRYDLQNKLMHYIERGDKEAVHQAINFFSGIMDFSDRLPGNPVRAAKNIASVSNTLYRVAAERAGVHPVYLHNMSERFAILIEKTVTINNLEKLMAVMAEDYCDLVQQFSTGEYRPIVRKAVDFIQLNLGEKLSLEVVAAELFITPSHLSRKFKEDTGVSMTEFINQKRVEEAKWYLERDTIAVTDVALMVGFNDVNYFSKVFKRYTGMAPTAYVKENSM
ncbi:helix-turn-helix transcriptional regulator [Virgibacillus sediminis]|uniref:Helix-turn-helix transcriptional regulator n=1 Tax=Virgibacillus sediminis TaxID=202260 RepID=A0ABV7A966_9BACI